MGGCCESVPITNKTEMRLDLGSMKEIEGEMVDIYREIKADGLFREEKLSKLVKDENDGNNSSERARGKTKATITTMNNIRTKTLTQKNISIDAQNLIIEEEEQECTPEDKDKQFNMDLKQRLNLESDYKGSEVNSGTIDLYKNLLVEGKRVAHSYVSDLSLGLSGGIGKSSAYSSKKHPYANSVMSRNGDVGEDSSKSKFGSIFARAHYGH